MPRLYSSEIEVLLSSSGRRWRRIPTFWKLSIYITLRQRKLKIENLLLLVHACLQGQSNSFSSSEKVEWFAFNVWSLPPVLPILEFGSYGFPMSPGWSIRHYMSLHYITLHEDPDHLEQSSHDASNICEDTEHERNPDDSEEEAEQAAAERAGCKVAVAWETQ